MSTQLSTRNRISFHKIDKTKRELYQLPSFTLFPSQETLQSLADKKEAKSTFIIGETEEEILKMELMTSNSSTQHNIVVVSEEGNKVSAPKSDHLYIERSYNDALRPWYDSDADPYGRVIRMKPHTVILHNMGIKACFFPWQAVDHGHSVVGGYVKNSEDSIQEVIGSFITNPFSSDLIILTFTPTYIVTGRPESYSVFEVKWNK